MDFSKEYIKMCDCIEIQNQYPRKGDWFMRASFPGEPQLWVGDDDGSISYTEMADKSEFGEDDNRMIGHIWLPRQDQLQDMMNDNVRNTVFLSGMYKLAALRKYSSGHSDTDFALKSFEQMWLAIVMYEKFNKTWNGDSWKMNTRK